MAKKKDIAPVEPVEAEEVKKSSKKFVILGALLVVAAFVVGQKMSSSGSAVSSTVVVVDNSTTTTIDPLLKVAIPLDPVVVNLSDGRFLKVVMTITVVPESGGEAIDPETMKPRFDTLRDEALSYLSGHTADEVLEKKFKTEFKAHMLERAELEFKDAIGDIAIPEWVAS